MAENPRLLVQNTRKFLNAITVARVIYYASSLSSNSHKEMKRGFNIACTCSVLQKRNRKVRKPQSYKRAAGKLPTFPYGERHYLVILKYKDICAKEEKDASLSSLSRNVNKPVVAGSRRHLSFLPWNVGDTTISLRLFAYNSILEKTVWNKLTVNDRQKYELSPKTNILQISFL